MNASLMDKSLTEERYEEYIDKIINIFRLSSKNSSILFDLKIKDYQAITKLSIVNQDGQNEEFSDVILNCDEVFFHNFLLPLVKRMNEVVSIETKDVVNLSDNDLVTFRMITTNNDLFTIDGLSKDDAKSLLSSITEEKKLKENNLTISNNDGKVSVMFFLLMIGVFILTIFLVVTFIG